MKKLLFAATALAPLAFAAPVSAAALNGTIVINVNQVQQTASTADLFSSTSLALKHASYGTGLGSFSAISFNSIDDSVLTFASLSSYSFTSADGNFVASSGLITNQTGSSGSGSESMTVYLLGVYTPTFGSFDASPASITFTFNQTGTPPLAGSSGSISGSATLASPPVPAPEPATLAVLGVGLLGLSLVRRRV